MTVIVLFLQKKLFVRIEYNIIRDATAPQRVDASFEIPFTVSFSGTLLSTLLKSMLVLFLPSTPDLHRAWSGALNLTCSW